MPIINITVKGKVASSDTKAIVNGNSDYAVNWVLDGEWADYDTKTMRVRHYDGTVIDCIFTGCSCNLPIITETCMIEIGLFAGDLITSTPAVINCIRCIRDDEGPVQDPTPSIYDQLLAKLNELGSGSAMRVDGGYVQYSTDNGKTWVNLIAEADLKGDPGAPGAPGKDGHSPVVTATKSGKTTTISVDGTAIATVEDGADGKPGAAGQAGASGADGITPHIGDNGNWYLGDTDTGKPSRGEQGVKGDTGPQGLQGIQGVQGPQGERGPAGADGATGPQGPVGPKGDTGDTGPAGQSAYAYAVDGGYTGTETEFAEKLAQEQLTGTTNELTPTQVYEAVSAGVPVKVQYFDYTFGWLSYTNFAIAETINVIGANTIAYLNGTNILGELFGDKTNNSWSFITTTLAEKTDIPTTLPNPNAITFTGAVTGSYNGSAPMSVNIPNAVTDAHINSLIDTKLGVIENGAY